MNIYCLPEHPVYEYLLFTGTPCMLIFTVYWDTLYMKIYFYWDTLYINIYCLLGHPVNEYLLFTGTPCK